MAESNPKPQTEVHAGDASKTKSALREEAVLAFWQEHDIFEKSLKKPAPKGNFVFFDGPPYATGLPHFGHIIPSTIKDIIPRYKTMQGYNVQRKWGWDCHGLPIENLIEKELGLVDKKAIEEFGIDKFNKAAKDSVFRYDIDWKRLVRRAGRWVDMENDYHTMDSSYTESVWWSFKTLAENKKYHKDGLVYEAFKVMPFCPRCQTSLSNFEVGQGYKDIPDISAYVLFELRDEGDTSSDGHTGESFLAWTTTPWTLPGNTALAVNPELKYSLIETVQKDIPVKVWVASDLISKLKEKNILPEACTTLKEVKGSELVGQSYVPPFDFYTKPGTLPSNQEAKINNAWKVYAGDFVTAEDGTGIVHIAPAFGDDDYKLAVAQDLPIIIHVGTDGKIKEGNGSLSGLYAKPKGDHQLTDIEVIKLLAHNTVSVAAGNAPLLFAKEKLVHSYPHCWRCDTPLLNYATSSWFVRVTELKDKLIEENNKVNWIPKEVGEGRFGKWIENVRDWAISRSRYWGAPLPIWRGQKSGKVEIIGSVEELKLKIKGRGNAITLMRHGEAESNVLDVISSDRSEEGREKHGLTMRGKGQVEEAAQKIHADQKESGKKITKIYASDFRRTRETAERVASALGLDASQIIFDARLREINGGDFDGGKWSERASFFNGLHDTIYKKVPNGESVEDVKKRTAEFLYDLDSKHEDENILVITHGLPLRLMINTVNGKTCRDLLRSGWRDYSDPNASLHVIDFKPLPHNESMELDLHRPYIDAVTWESKVEEGIVFLDGTKSVGGETETMVRVPEVFDVWYDSGSMPFAQAHYPFENKELFEQQNSPIFPADFIAEGLDQTRGWFYSLMVLGVGLFDKSPYKNVIVNGLMLAEDGRKMSKSLKNYPPMEPTFDKYGVDPLRYFIASSSVTHSEEVLFSEKILDEINKKIFNRLENVYSFYVLYADNVPMGEGGEASEASNTPDSVPHSDNILDKWIIARLAELKSEIEKGLDTYQIDKAARPIADIVDDLSTWYLRRSRERFKGDDAKDKEQAMQTTRFALLTFSKLVAPFIPFMAEHMYQNVRNEIARLSSTSAILMPESVHLTDWPTLPPVDHTLIESMKVIRKLVETGLALRAKAGIKVRQPLASFTFTEEDASGATGIEFSKEMLEIIKEELNVKEVRKGSELALDTNLTVELKEEGVVRDIIRGAQEARKNEGLVPSDTIALTVSASAPTLEILRKNEEMLKKPIQAERVEYIEMNDVEEALLKVSKI